jgi:hypothetical protein
MGMPYCLVCDKCGVTEESESFSLIAPLPTTYMRNEVRPKSRRKRVHCTEAI